jgi:hypothetical protein
MEVVVAARGAGIAGESRHQSKTRKDCFVDSSAMSPADPRLEDKHPVGGRPLSRRVALCALCGLLPALALSCATARPMKIGLPAKNSIRSDQLLIVSDFRMPRDHPLIEDLKALRRQVSDELELPLGSKTVTVYLFSNEQEYTQYLHATFPGYPPRRAYFIQTPGKDLAVYTWWGDRIQEDLRHEFTHGLLHACLENVPLWLDGDPVHSCITPAFQWPCSSMATLPFASRPAELVGICCAGVANVLPIKSKCLTWAGTVCRCARADICSKAFPRALLCTSRTATGRL